MTAKARTSARKDEKKRKALDGLKEKIYYVKY